METHEHPQLPAETHYRPTPCLNSVVNSILSKLWVKTSKCNVLFALFCYVQITLVSDDALKQEKERKRNKDNSSNKKLGSESFTRWLVGVSVRARAWAQDLMHKVFAFPLPESAKRSIRDQVGQSVPTTYDCPHYSSCIHFQAKPSFVGPYC